MPLNVAIIDYGMGNLQSVYRRLEKLGAQPFIAATANEIFKADKIILPGVGHFKKAMINLQQKGLHEALNEVVLIKKIPVLGICLGMQLMAKDSEEGDARGFGWIDARVVKFNIENTIKFKVPQTGWNTINSYKQSHLLSSISEGAEFYFLHSYHCEITHPGDVLAKTNYEVEFVSAIEKEHIFGTQFHPEKSHQPGAQVLQNFIHL